jgi:hypothetical protein
MSLSCSVSSKLSGNLNKDRGWETSETLSTPPFEREISRDHLDNLLEQGIIAPVSETEDLLISSPIVLVSKWSNNAGKPSAQDFRFCCDYRFLYSQTREFKYTIPDLH